VNNKDEMLFAILAVNNGTQPGFIRWSRLKDCTIRRYRRGPQVRSG